jgi:hypothetical protein
VFQPDGAVDLHCGAALVGRVEVDGVEPDCSASWGQMPVVGSIHQGTAAASLVVISSRTTSSRTPRRSRTTAGEVTARFLRGSITPPRGMKLEFEVTCGEPGEPLAAQPDLQGWFLQTWDPTTN